MKPESLEQESHDDVHVNGKVPEGTSTGQEPISSNRVYIFIQEKKCMIILGFLALLLIGSGIAVGIVIAMQPGFQIDNQKTYKFGGHNTVVTRGALKTTEDGIQYQVYGTHELQPKSSGRLLRAHHKMHKLKTHLVFPKHGVVITQDTNSSIDIRVDPVILVPILMNYDSALQEIISRYTQSSNSTDMTDLSEEINLYMRSILNQLFTAQFGGKTSIDFSQKYYLEFEEKQGKLHVKGHSEHRDHKRLLWFDSWSAVRLFSQNPVPSIAEVAKTQFHDGTAQSLSDAVESQKQDPEQSAHAAVQPQKQDLDSLSDYETDNCVPTGETTMSCELSGWNAGGSYDNNGNYQATVGYQNGNWNAGAYYGNGGYGARFTYSW